MAEVAVAGRSNVGKSSLLNAVANHQNLAKTSKTPGRTQLLNCFRLEGGRQPGPTVVDLPGYGYAKTSKTVRDGFAPMIEGYLTTRDELVMLAVLVDGAIGPTPLDVQMVDWVRAIGLPHTVIATKSDKVKSSQRAKRRKELANGLDLDTGDVEWVSASKNDNIARLRDLFRLWLQG